MLFTVNLQTLRVFRFCRSIQTRQVWNTQSKSDTWCTFGIEYFLNSCFRKPNHLFNSRAQWLLKRSNQPLWRHQHIYMWHQYYCSSAQEPEKLVIWRILVLQSAYYHMTLLVLFCRRQTASLENSTPGNTKSLKCNAYRGLDKNTKSREFHTKASLPEQR